MSKRFYQGRQVGCSVSKNNLGMLFNLNNSVCQEKTPVKSQLANSMFSEPRYTNSNAHSCAVLRIDYENKQLYTCIHHLQDIFP